MCYSLYIAVNICINCSFSTFIHLAYYLPKAKHPACDASISVAKVVKS